MKELSPISYEKERKNYGLLCSLPIFISIIHAIGQILMQTFLTFDTASLTYSKVPGFGMMYASSMFSSLVSTSLNEAKGVNSIASIISVVLTILFISLSSAAVKGKKLPVLLNLIFYSVDTLFIIPTLILDGMNIYPLDVTVVDYVLVIVLHVFGTIGNIYLFVLSKRLEAYERQN